MYEGSCLCGTVKYKLLCEPEYVAHCHCTMCQKQHGAAFATYASVHKDQLVYLSGADALSEYNSSSTIKRKFCTKCGSNIEWSGSPEYPDWVSITVATLDSPFSPGKIENIYTDTSVCWLNPS